MCYHTNNYYKPDDNVMFCQLLRSILLLGNCVKKLLNDKININLFCIQVDQIVDNLDVRKCLDTSEYTQTVGPVIECIKYWLIYCDELLVKSCCAKKGSILPACDFFGWRVFRTFADNKKFQELNNHDNYIAKYPYIAI